METITKQLEALGEEFCDKYCKFPDKCKAEIGDSDEAFEYLMEHHCTNCPVMRFLMLILRKNL